MAWWDIIPNSRCIFAIDGNSYVNAANNIILSNNDQNFDINVDGMTSSVSKVILSSLKISNHQIMTESIFSYKSLNIKKKNLIFKSPIIFEDQATLILICKVRSPSQLLETASGVEGPWIDSKRYWEVGNFATALDSNIDKNYTMNAFNGVDTLIVEIDRIKGELRLKTTYGIITVKTNFPGGSFASSDTSYTVIGDVTNSGHYFDGNIVAYGAFNRLFNENEFSQILAKIDEELLVKKATVVPSNTGISLKGSLSRNSNNVKSIDFTLYNTNYQKPEKIEKANYIKPKTDIFTIGVEKISEIKDYVYKENIGVRATLYLYERYSGELVSRTISDENGYFEFLNLDSNLEYVIASHDPDHQFKSIIKNYGK